MSRNAACACTKNSGRVMDFLPPLSIDQVQTDVTQDSNRGLSMFLTYTVPIP